MKHLKLFFALFAMLALGVGNAWGATYSLTPNKAGTGLSNTAYITSLTEFTNNGISWKMNQWNPSSLQIKTNQGSAADEWRFYNTSAIPGKITKVVIKFSALTLKSTSATGFKFVGGSSAVTGTTGGTDGVWNASAKTLTWTPTASDNFTYFALYQNGKVATGTNKLATSDAIVVTYETSGDEETVPSLTEEQFSWSAAAATANLPDKFDEKPTLTNTEDLAVSYSTSNDKVATIDANGNVTLVGVGTADIKATAGDGVTFEETTVAYTLTVKPAPLVIEPIEGGIIDILTHKTFAATSNQYTNFTSKQATNENHSDAVYAGKTARNGNATQYSIQLNTIDKGRIATTTTGGLAKRVYVRWSTQETLNTNARELYIYGSNNAYTGNETAVSGTKIGSVKFTTGAAEAYVDLTGDYKYILMTGSGAIYMDEIHVTWVSAAGTVVTPTISGETEFVESTEVSISTEEGYKVYYTLDGTNPTNASTEYTAPFTVNATTTVKAVAYDGATASDVVSKTLKALEILTCEAAAEKCAATESTDKYVVRGYVTSIPYPYSATNTTPTFWMADTKDGGNVMQAYKVTPVNDADEAVAVGDQVQVIGKIKLYNSTPEVNGGTYTITVPNPKYNVNITSAHGTVTATPTSAVEGTEITLSVEVETGWVFQSWTVTDASSNPIEVTDNKFTMPASDVIVVANYTESVAPDAVLTLMANGNQHSQETYKVGETVELPDNIANDCVKQFVGWSTEEIEEPLQEKPTSNFYAPGADFELTATEHTLYAVYASGTTGETVTIKHNSTTTTNMTGVNEANTFFGLDATAWSIVAAKGGNSNNVGLNKDGTIRLYYAAAGGNTLTVTAPSKVATIQLTFGTLNNAWVKVNGNKVTPTDGVYTIDAETFVIGNANTENVQVHIKNIAVTLAGELANFSTTCSGALAAPTFSVAEGEYTEAQSITLSAAEGTIYYTLDGSTPTSESDVYSSEAIVLDKCGEFTIKAIAIGTESESPVASATYTLALPIPANDAENPYTGTEAIEVYNGGCYDGTTLVYVTGTVQEVEYSSQYGNYEITFADGFQCYRLQETATEKFTEDKIGAGDVIVACGKLDKYGSKYQLAQGCYLVKHTPSVKADAELAWNPETVTLTVGDAFTAPTLVNPHSVTGITYETSNDEVATVSAEGVIALVDDAVGTATITATFDGDATYKPATVTCTIQVKPVQEDCEGSDDFETATATNASSYNTRTTDAGWKATNAAKTTIEGYTYLIINGKTSAVGTITSPELNGGIGSIKIRYANTYSENNGVSFKLDIKQNDEVVKTYTVTKAEVVQNTVYTELIEDINVEGDFVMVFTNLSPSKDTGNKDRVSIGRLCWTGYEIPKYTITTTAEHGTVTGAGTYPQGAEVSLTADPAMDHTFVNWTKGGEVVSTANPFVFEATENLDLVANFQEIVATTKTLTGTFSVGQYEVAQFATGNLQYTNGTWGFAKQQYQYVGDANINVGDPTFTGTIDMFGWSTNETNYGVDPRNVNEFYDGEFVDWGNIEELGDGWSTLSADQWKYLLNTRTKAEDLKQIARVGSVVGIMLFPDVWNAPLTVTAKRDSYFDVDIHNYTLEQWAALENAGALFLPAAGRRTGGYGNMINYDQEEEETNSENLNGGHYKHQDNTNIYCYYWTSTINETTKNVSYLHNIQALGGNKYTIGTGAIWGEKGRYGQSVRLAKVTSTLIEIGDDDNSAVITANAGKEMDVQVNRTFKANDGYYTICLPFNIDADEIGKAYQVTSISDAGAEGFNMVFSEVTELVAGQPYLIEPKDLTNPIFENVTISYTGEGETVAATNSVLNFEMVGVINGGGQTELGQYWVGDSGYFYNGDGTQKTDKLGLRVLFNITNTEGQRVNVRARVVVGENTTTGLDNITNGEDTTIKVIENGQLIIIRNGEKFNAQGQRL